MCMEHAYDGRGGLIAYGSPSPWPQLVVQSRSMACMITSYVLLLATIARYPVLQFLPCSDSKEAS